MTYTSPSLLNHPQEAKTLKTAQTIDVPHQIYYEDEHILVLQTLAMAIDNQNNVDITQVLQTTQNQQTIQSQQEHVNSFGDFNLGLHVNDDAKQVLQHRCQLLKQLNQHLITQKVNKKATHKLIQHHSQSTLCPVKQIYWLNQVHGNQVVDIEAMNATKLIHLDVDKTKLADKNSQPAQKMNPDFCPMSADAMTSCQTGNALAIMTADCVPIMLYQPNTGRIAAVHAGWQGLASGVIANTVKQFDANQLDVGIAGSGEKDGYRDADAQEQLPLATDSSIMAWIGACISVNNYEVGTDVLDKLLSGSLNHFKFQQNEVELATAISQPHQQAGKVWLNLPKMARMQLASLRVQVQNTQIPCSYKDLHYYSYRRKTHLQHANTGRMAMIIVRHSD